MAVSCGGALLCLGQAPVATMINAKERGLCGVGRPQQTAKRVERLFLARKLMCMLMLTSYSLLNWGGGTGDAVEVIAAVCL